MSQTLISPAADIHPSANVYRSEIGLGTKVAAFVEIGGAQVGARCKIQAFAFIPPGVTIEDEVFIGPHVCFTNDRTPRATGHWRLEPTRVCRGASIGAGAIILPGVTIGPGAMIAAGSIVTTSIPGGHLYEGRLGRERTKRWWNSQADVGLPMTFDEWRRRYDDLSLTEQQAFYDAIGEFFPEQNHCTLDEARAFFGELGGRPTVLEVGGWDGSVGRTLLEEIPAIQHWWNFELSSKAVVSGVPHPRYTPVVADRFVWDVPELPVCQTFFASHVIEHLRAAQLDRLLARLRDVDAIYLEAPLPASATDHDWDGRWNTHILEIGWQQVEDRLAARDFHVWHRAPDVRWFHR